MKICFLKGGVKHKQCSSLQECTLTFGIWAPVVKSNSNGTPLRIGIRAYVLETYDSFSYYHSFVDTRKMSCGYLGLCTKRFLVTPQLSIPPQTMVFRQTVKYSVAQIITNFGVINTTGVFFMFVQNFRREKFYEQPEFQDKRDDQNKIN